jgi:NadR type nicotinamide-nucleotide adenylyltransferase
MCMGVKPLKIAIIGAESTGKSSLAAALAAHYHTCFVPEKARVFLEKTNGVYTETDLIKFAEAQLKAENETIKKASKILFCDTDISNIRIWSEIKYGRCALDLLNLNVAAKYDAALLCNIDLPWQADALRENPDMEMRNKLHLMYLDDLVANEVRFGVVSGVGEEREEMAVGIVEGWLVGL